jgi:DNA-directed RNA polymerase subunit RPC12/RpoP
MVFYHMGLVNKIQMMLAGDETETLYSHGCGDCGATFEAPEPNPNHVECPECGSDRIHTTA